MIIKLSHFLHECAKLPAKPKSDPFHKLAFQNGPLEFNRAIGPPVFDLVEFRWDGKAWQVSQETPVTLIP